MQDNENRDTETTEFTEGIEALPENAPMSADAMRFLFELGKKQRDYTIKEINGATYVNTSPKYPLERIGKYERPAPNMFTAYSLSGLVEYLKNDVDEHFRRHDALHVVVENTDRVTVYSPIHGESNRRDLLARCVFTRPDIPFDRYMNQETFSVMLQTHFDEGENRARVLAVTGNLCMEEGATLADDGVTQAVTLRSGIARKEDVQIANPVLLAPHRTFPEVEQPASPFVLRVRKGEGAELALFQADSGAWKIEAVARIGAWLTDALKDVCAVVIA